MITIRSAIAPLVVDLDASVAGWASRSLVGSLRRTALVMVAIWQLVMVIAAVVSVGLSAWPLLIGNVGLAAYALFASRNSRSPVWCVPVIMGSLGVAGYVASGDIGSALVFAACWQINLATCAAALLLFSRWVVPAALVGAISVSVLILLWLPEWGTQLPVVIPVTQAAIIAALRLGLAQLLAMASRADRKEAIAEEARNRAEIARRVSTQVAEESRMLHDTAINTLGAIANGGAGTRDLEQVRTQCARDVAVLDALREERTGLHNREESLFELFTLPGLPITRHGLDDRAIEHRTRSVPRAAISGMTRAAREAILNANRHSQASSIDVTIVEHSGGLRVEIHDDGIGFDGTYPAGRGLAGSVFERGRDFGFDASLITSPGAGTTIALTAIPHADLGQPLSLASGDVEAVVGSIHRRAGLLWSGGVTVVSVILTAIGGTNHNGALFPMLAVMLAAWVVYYAMPRQTLRWWGTLGLTASTIVVFWLSAAATAFGTDGTVHWQSLAASAPFTLLLSSCPTPRVVLAAGAVCAASVVGLAAVTVPSSTTGAAIIVVAGAVGGVFSFVWSRFMRNVATLSEDAANAHRHAVQAQRAADADQAAQETYRRWVVAGLDSAADVLRSIAAGDLDPQNPVTRAAAGTEEAYLRQLVLVGPELVHLGHAIMPILRYARDLGVTLDLRLGARDTADEYTAQDLSSAVMRAVDATDPGGLLIVSVFPVSEGVLLTLVGSDRHETGQTGVHRSTPLQPGRGIQQMVFATTAPGASEFPWPETSMEGAPARG